jgi:hypothetical protein
VNCCVSRGTVCRARSWASSASPDDRRSGTTTPAQHEEDRAGGGISSPVGGKPVGPQPDVSQPTGKETGLRSHDPSHEAPDHPVNGEYADVGDQTGCVSRPHRDHVHPRWSTPPPPSRRIRQTPCEVPVRNRVCNAPLSMCQSSRRHAVSEPQVIERLSRRARSTH